MADRNQPPLGGQRPLLPAPSPRTTTDGHMQGKTPDGGNGADGVQSKAAGKSLKRAKVTAVACQPCQKRKSKCDGQRPICSACNTKRTETDCHYDSAGDQRRTTSLKERIDAGERENEDLKTIIETMCTDPSTVNLVRDRLVLNNSVQTREIANVLRARLGSGEATAITSPPNNYSVTTAALGYNGYTAFQGPLFQGPPYSHGPFLHDDAAPSPTATIQSSWSSEVVSGEEREEADFAFEGTYPLPGGPSWA
ncbi:hypothetical protein BLS_003645 [Venturia inaequalis]|uniref:Zn(2)-C6 fungal-type domain-containing protein n=1 Tax=Venturia inaequalis TaxID=5025 RepID=A0A8H3UMG9_VENIN|nr:hypothetical protein BLS_003645 [Venturia inaequalis]KAE9985674.1 hypothetical protein EG328_007088 [Venturia inaequalis]RDI85558.1 Adenosylhomocysteinase [Venturia inaequalis]